MKNKIKFLSFIALLAIVVNACQKEPDLRMPELTRVATSFDQIPTLQKNSEGDFNFDFTNMSSTAGKIDVVCEDPSLLSDVKLMFMVGGDLTKTAEYADVTAFPSTFDVSPTGIVDAIDDYAVVEDIEKGESFTFYLSYTLNGVKVETFTEGYDSFSAGVLNVPDVDVSVAYTVLCPFDMSKFVGDYYEIEDGAWYGDVVTFSVHPEHDNWLVIKKFFGSSIEYYSPGESGSSELIIEIDPVTYTLSLPVETLEPSEDGLAQFFWDGNLAGGYGRLDLVGEEFSGLANTCTGEIGFDVPVRLSDAGYWFGWTSFSFEKVSKDPKLEQINKEIK